MTRPDDPDPRRSGADRDVGPLTSGRDTERVRSALLEAVRRRAFFMVEMPFAVEGPEDEGSVFIYDLPVFDMSRGVRPIPQSAVHLSHEEGRRLRDELTDVLSMIDEGAYREGQPWELWEEGT